MTYPAVATRSCQLCKAWDYDEATGRVKTHLATDRPLKRQPGTPLPCDVPGGCPKGNPTAGIELSDFNFRAYKHYIQCRATGRFPDDPLVARHAAIIHEVEQQVKEDKQSKLIQLLIGTRG